MILDNDRNSTGEKDQAVQEIDDWHIDVNKAMHNFVPVQEVLHLSPSLPYELSGEVYKLHPLASTSPKAVLHPEEESPTTTEPVARRRGRPRKQQTEE